MKVDKTSTKIPSKYADFANIFSSKLAVELPKYTRIKDHVIKLVDDQQSSCGPIYSLELVKLEILKKYIKNNLTNDFTRLFKSPTRVSIFLDKKQNKDLKLYVDY